MRALMDEVSFEESGTVVRMRIRVKTSLGLKHGNALLFVCVLAQQNGLPLPLSPLLLATCACPSILYGCRFALGWVLLYGRILIQPATGDDSWLCLESRIDSVAVVYRSARGPDRLEQRRLSCQPNGQMPEGWHSLRLSLTLRKQTNCPSRYIWFRSWYCERDWHTECFDQETSAANGKFSTRGKESMTAAPKFRIDVAINDLLTGPSQRPPAPAAPRALHCRIRRSRSFRSG
jgi:hypothetical protein